MINLDDRKTRCLSLDNICVVIGGSQWGRCFYGLRLSVIILAICCCYKKFSLRLTFYDDYRLQFVNVYAWRLNFLTVLRISVNPVENLLLTFRLSADYKRKIKLPELKLDNWGHWIFKMMLKYIFQKTPKHGCNVFLQGMIVKCTRNAWLSSVLNVGRFIRHDCKVALK